jgi:hypothetical protein
MNQNLIDDDYLLLYMSGYFSVRDFIQVSRVNKRLGEKMITDELDKRTTCIDATITICETKQDFRFVCMDTCDKWHKIKFNGKLYFEDLLIDSKITIMINTPFWKFNCKERLVFGNDIQDTNEFEISFADTNYASIKFHCINDDKNAYIDELILEYRRDMKYQIKKNKMICNGLSLTTIATMIYLLYRVILLERSFYYAAFCCIYGILILGYNQSDDEITIKLKV